MAKLYFKYGTMNSSKSAQLLMSNHNYLSQDRKTLVFKPSLDTRVLHTKSSIDTGALEGLASGIVESRALNSVASAILIDKDAKNVMAGLARRFTPDCILVDEVQFMPIHQIDELADIVDNLQIPVIAFGLMSDFKSNLFEGSKRLIEVGAVLNEIKTVCSYCKVRATMNMRFLNGNPVFEGKQVELGGNEAYKPVCRACYNKFKAQI